MSPNNTWSTNCDVVSSDGDDNSVPLCNITDDDDVEGEGILDTEEDDPSNDVVAENIGKKRYLTKYL